MTHSDRDGSERRAVPYVPIDQSEMHRQWVTRTGEAQISDLIVDRPMCMCPSCEDADATEPAGGTIHRGTGYFMEVPAGPPLHEATDRDGDNVPSGEECGDPYPLNGWRNDHACIKPKGHHGSHLDTFPGGSNSWATIEDAPSDDYARALRNPGAFVERLTVTDSYEDGRYSRELLTDWQARACVAVEDRHTAALLAEVTRLRGMVDRLARRNEDDAERWSGVLSEAEASEALNTTAATAAIETWQWREVEQRQRADKAEATIARVEALADLWISREGWFDPSMDTQTHLIADRVYAQVGKRLRAALRGPSEREGRA